MPDHCGHAHSERRCVVISLLALTCRPALPDEPVGLQTRPANLTCVAPERPVIDPSAALQTAWPNHSFMTVPAAGDLDHRIGPIAMAQVPGDNSHWYVAERAGKIHRVVNDDAADSFTTVLDITARFDGIDYFQQWGINAFAFHPDFANNGWLFAIYNDSDGPGRPAFHVIPCSAQRDRLRQSGRAARACDGPDAV